VTDRPDRGAAAEQEPRSGAPADEGQAGEPSDEEFWRLAKKGLAAWGHEPTTEEIVGYWQGLIDEQRRDVAGGADDPPPVEDPVAVLMSLAEPGRTGDAAPDRGTALLAGLLDLRRPDHHVAAVRSTADGAVARLAGLVGLVDLGRSAGASVAGESSDVAIGVLAGLVDLGRSRAPAPAPVVPRPVVTAEAVGWLAVPVAGMPAPLPPAPHRTWWRVAPGAEPAPVTVVPPALAVPPVPAGPGAPVAPAPARGEAVAGAAGADGVGRGVALGLGGGGLAFADCLVTLDRRRRAQQGRRHWGRHIALPVAPLDADERELRHGADAAAAELVEVALRAAAAGAGPGGLPPIDRVEATPDHVVVVLAGQEREPAPPGFLDVRGPPGTCLWTTGADREELEAASARALPPLPLVAPLGRTTTGRERLVDLEARGVATVDGAPDDVAGLLRATVVAMATTAWCTPLRIVAVGLGRELTGLPGVEVVDSLDVALTFAEAHAHQVATALEAVGESSPGWVRAQGLSTAAAGALLVVSARPPDDAAIGRRVAALAGRRSSGIGVLLRHARSPDAGLAAGVGRALRIGDDGALHDGDVGPAGEPVWARRLDAADARRLVELLAVADRRDDGHAAVRPPRAARGDDPAAGPDLLVRVLGGVEIADLDAAEIADLDAAVEVLAYLALREASVTHAMVEAALFPDGSPGADAVDRRVAAAAELVGPGLVRRPTPGRYAVSERVATDHGLLCDLVARADDAIAAEDLAVAADHLTAALALVRAVPLDGHGRGYPWAGPAREAIVAQVVDAADSLAGLRARSGDWDAVDRAAVQGLRASPASERLHRWRMRAAHAAGDVDRVHELFETVCDLVADPAVGVEPEDTLQPETVALLEALVSRRAAGESIAPPADPRAPGAPGPTEPGEVRRLAPDRPLPVTEELPEVAAGRPPDALIA
jgi:hypothetical protein